MEGSVMDKDQMWDTLLDMGVQEETLMTVAKLNGYTRESMEDVLYVLFGYRSFHQLSSEEE